MLLVKIQEFKKTQECVINNNMGIMLETPAGQEYDNNKNMELTKDNHTKMSVEIPRMFFPILLLMLRRSGSYAVVVRYIVLLCMLCKKNFFIEHGNSVDIYIFCKPVFKIFGPLDTGTHIVFLLYTYKKIKQVLFSLNSK